MGKGLGAAGLVSRAFAVLALAGSLVACAAAGPAGAASRLPVHSENAIVIVEGRGVVTGAGQIDCRAGSADEGCLGAWVDLWQPSLVATPEPGWRFDRWELESPDASLALVFGNRGETTKYKAIFVPAKGRIGRR